MKTKYRPLAITAAVAVLVMLTGCTGAQEKVQEKTQEIVGATTGAIEKTVRKTVDTHMDHLKENGATLELSASAQENSASQLTLDNAVGNVEIQGTKGNEVTVDVKITAYQKNFSEVDLQSVFDQAEVTLTPEGEELIVSTHAKEDPSRNLWDWADKKYNYSEFSIDYTIGLPDQITAFHINNDVGNVTLTGLSGSYRVENQVGEIQIKDAGITGESKVSNSTGSIELNIVRMESKGSLDVTGEIGSIDVTLADSVNCDLETRADAGEISGAPEGKSRRGDGGPLLSLTASLGTITVK